MLNNLRVVVKTTTTTTTTLPKCYNLYFGFDILESHFKQQIYVYKK